MGLEMNAVLIGIASFAVVLSAVSLYLVYDQNVKMSSLEEKLESTLGNTDNRGSVSQQSLSKMNPTLSMNNDNSIKPTIEKRLDAIEKDISKIKSSIKTTP